MACTFIAFLPHDMLHASCVVQATVMTVLTVCAPWHCQNSCMDQSRFFAKAATFGQCYILISVVRGSDFLKIMVLFSLTLPHTLDHSFGFFFVHSFGFFC